MQRFNPKEIEPKWQKIWAEQKTYQVDADPDKPKSYVTAMFPYPSGAGLHVGHVRNYSITDAIARFQRSKGKNVLTTIGWDGFGLPAENYAIKTGTPPAISTAANIKNFKSQLERLGMSYDWSREVNTTDPNYYRWTQWLFLKFFERGLAYQKESLQWWCPICKTVLANEQVINGGYCWRHEDTLVEKKWTKQWFFKITDYADALLDGLDDVDWPEKIKAMQRNWIGRSVGASIRFKAGNETVEVFTTRPDTIFGCTFLVLAPEHPLVNTLTTEEHKAQVEAYVQDAQKKSDVDRMNESREKTGVFTGAYATNPANNEQVPIWVADYLLMGYGTGAIMAVPGHDQRDYDFAKAFDLPIKTVVEPVSGEKVGDEAEKDAIVAIVRNPKDGKLLMLDWGPRQERWGGTLFVGGGIDDGEDPVACAKREIAEETGYTNVRLVSEVPYTVHSYYYSNVKNKNYYARMRGLLFELEDDTQEEPKLDEGEKEQFKLKWVSPTEADQLVDDDGHRYIFDYLIKNEIFHGEGIMVNSGEFSGQASSEARENIVKSLHDQGVADEKTNYRMRDWLISRQRYWGAPIPIIHCDKDGSVAVPEDQLPVVLPEVESFEPTGDGLGVLAQATEWVNTTCPKCGGPARRETDTLDGYVCSSWYLFRYADATNDQAPWDPEKADYWLPVDFYCGGDHAVAHLLYVRFWTKVLKEEGLLTVEEPIKQLVYNGYINAADGSKMSKSKGNVVDPVELIDQGYGADALRLYELFIGPYEQDAAWDPKGIAGTYRLLNRAWTLTQEFLESEAGEQTQRDIHVATHKAIKRITTDLERHSFNTAVAALMEYINELYKIKTDGFGDRGAWQFALNTFAQLLEPFAPHTANELWQQLGHDQQLHQAGWPEWDDNYLVSDTITIVVQINGKLRAQLQIAAGSDEASVIAAARSDERVASYLQSEPRKTIYVPNRLVNFVL